MASNVVGNLVVKLSAHTAEFDTKLGKAGETAKGFAGNVTTHTEAAGNKLESLGKRIASRLFGGGNVRLASAFEGAASSLTGISAAGLGTVGVLTGLGIVAKRFGDDLRADEREAAKLNISLADYQTKMGKMQLTEGAQLGVKGVSTAWENAWNFAKKITGEIAGWAMLPFFGWASGGPQVPRIPTPPNTPVLGAEYTGRGERAAAALDKFVDALIGPKVQTAVEFVRSIGMGGSAHLMGQATVADAAVRNKEADKREQFWRDEAAREYKNWVDKIKGIAEGLTISDPLVEFRKDMDLLNDGLRKGAINQAQYAGAVAGLRSKTVQEMGKGMEPGKLGGFFEAGSVQAYQQQLARERGTETTRQTALLEAQLKKEEESLTVQREIRDNIKPPGVAIL
jgi:hypothetical protein